MSLDAMLEDTADVQRATTSKDTSGGLQHTWAVVFAGIAVKIEDLTASAQLAYSMYQVVISHLVVCLQDGLAVHDRFSTSDGRLLLVEGVEKVRGQGGIETYFECPCSELRPGT